MEEVGGVVRLFARVDVRVHVRLRLRLRVRVRVAHVCTSARSNCSSHPHWVGTKPKRTPPKTSPRAPHRSGFFSGLCSPDLGTDLRLSTNGRSSAPRVSGTRVKGSPLRGSGTAMRAAASTHRPPTGEGGAGERGVSVGSCGAGRLRARECRGAPAWWRQVGVGRRARGLAGRRTQVLGLGRLRAGPLVHIHRRPAADGAPRSAACRRGGAEVVPQRGGGAREEGWRRAGARRREHRGHHCGGGLLRCPRHPPPRSVEPTRLVSAP